MAKPPDFPPAPALNVGTELYTQRLQQGGTRENYRFTIQTLYNFLVSEFGVGSTARHYQYFPPGDSLSLTITVDVATLPVDNNLITVHAMPGSRLFPDQGATSFDWSRDGTNAPTTITLTQRDGEGILVEW